MDGHLYKIENHILKRFIVDGNDTYETTVIPRSLIPHILQMVHDELGHNGTHRTYILLKRLYYWKGLKPSVEKHIKRYYQCQRRNRQVVKYARLHFDVATFPMQFISMDLIREFHPPTSRKHNRNLWSNLKYLAQVPRSTNVQTSRRAFSIVGPRLWNDLPVTVKMKENIREFKVALKTHLFRESYS